MFFMKNKYGNTLVVLATFFITTSCVPAAIIGGAGLVGYGASQERGIGGAISDATIEAKVTSYFLASKYKELFANVSADSVEGRVLLTGNVPSREAKVQAENITWGISGVKEVINQIQVRNAYEFKTKNVARDSWITTQVESRLLFSKNIASRNFSIETIDGVVYLMGIARDRNEMQAVAQTSAQVPGVKKVVSYIRLKGSDVLEKQSNITEVRPSGVGETFQGDGAATAVRSVFSEPDDGGNVSGDGFSDSTNKTWIAPQPNDIIEDETPTLPGSIRMGDQ